MATNQDTARSRHGYIIKYNNCPLVWKSQLQGEIALSSTESEYCGLLYALREVIRFSNYRKKCRCRDLTSLPNHLTSCVKCSRTTQGRWKWQRYTSIDLARSKLIPSFTISDLMLSHAKWKSTPSTP